MLFGTSAIENVSIFGLTESSVFLSDESKLCRMNAGSLAWQKLKLISSRERTRGRMFAVSSAHTGQDMYALQWEMHPAGDELVEVFSGHLILILKEWSGTRQIHLTAMTGVIVPAGVWHRFKLITPALLFAVTRGVGSQLRNVNDV